MDEWVRHQWLNSLKSAKKSEKLTDIDINLPKLCSLYIWIKLNASEWTAVILSRLLALDTIVIQVMDESIIPHIETKLNENSKKSKH